MIFIMGISYNPENPDSETHLPSHLNGPLKKPFRI
jgi:hypothetical protein